MTRDMELVRKIIIEIQKREDMTPSVMEIPGYDEVTVARHLQLLMEAGLIDGISSHPISLGYPIIMVQDLTWSGHDFAAALDNEGVWQKIKQSFSAAELATLPLIVLKDIGVKLVTEWAKSKVGLGGEN